MNETLDEKVKVYWHDASPAIGPYKRDGLLRKDLRHSGLAERGGIKPSAAGLIVHELHFEKYEHMLWNEYGTATPAHVVTLDGVPLVTFYRRPPASP